MSKQNNQNFVLLPHARFIEMVTYKAQLVGITVILSEESHTSKSHELRNELISSSAPAQKCASLRKETTIAFR